MGAEFQATTSLTHKLDLTAAYTYLDAAVTKANDGTVGFRIWAIPRNAASLWANYKLNAGEAKGIELGGGVRYTGETVDQSNTLHVPDFTLLDARASYDLGSHIPGVKGTNLQVNVKNLLNKQYIQTCVNGCYYGFERSITATMRYDW